MEWDEEIEGSVKKTYTVSWEESSRKRVQDEIDDFFYTIGDLTSNTEYEISVIAENSEGASIASTPKSSTTRKCCILQINN